MSKSDKLHIACGKGEFDIVKSLLEGKCDIDEPGDLDQRPIHFACANGHVDIVKILIENKCDIEACDKKGQRPIHIACDNGNVDMVKLLLEVKCDIEACCNNDQPRPVHIACYNGHIDIVKLLIEHKCDLEAYDWNGQPPIHIVCIKGNIDIVKLLIVDKRYIEARDKSDRRPIHITCDKRHVNIVKLLVEHKCDIEAYDKNGQTPIYFACGNGDIDIIKLLIEYKCDIEVCNKNGQRPIHIACANGYVDVVKLLIEMKCDIEACDKDDKRPIHFACENGKVDVAKLLIESKCEIESQDKNNWRPIHFASRFGSNVIAKLLIAHRCDMNAITKDNESPMSIAKQYNHKQLITLMEYELFKEKLLGKIKKAFDVKCGNRCNHKSCPRSLISAESQNNEFIGNGTYGKVYKLTDRRNKMEYALKSIKIFNESAKEKVKILENDINNYRDIIKYPGIMEYFGCFSDSKEIHIFMEFFPKGSLDDEILKSVPLPHHRIIRYTKQILEGVEFLHCKKVIHGDVKPRNILLDDDDRTILCDYGLSNLSSISIRNEPIYNDKQNKDVQANKYSTTNYMAPEVINGDGYSFSADIWSVGATVAHMLSGQPPYFGTHPASVIMKIAIEKKIDFEPLEPMSDNMKLFMKETLNPDPSKRAMAKELLQFLIDHDMT